MKNHKLSIFIKSQLQKNQIYSKDEYIPNFNGIKLPPYQIYLTEEQWIVCVPKLGITNIRIFIYHFPFNRERDKNPILSNYLTGKQSTGQISIDISVHQ